MKPRLYRGFNDAVAIERGPLVYALPIAAEWKKVKDNRQFADWEVYPRSPWNYALQLDREHPERSIAFEDRPVGKNPVLDAGRPGRSPSVKGRRVPAWGLERGAAAPPPREPRGDHGAPRRPDADPLRLHRPANHRVPPWSAH